MNGRQSELSPAEASQVHAAATAAGLHPVRIEVDVQGLYVFHAGERSFDHLAEWLEYARELAQLRMVTP